MKTGRYRFRTGWGGAQVLQVEHEGAMQTGGTVNTAVRVLSWSDATPSQAQDVLDMIAIAKAKRRSTPTEACPLQMTGIGWECTACGKLWNHVSIPFDERVCGREKQRQEGAQI
jgi:hypothetical protein